MFENTKKLCDSLLDLGVPGFDLCVYKDGECVLRYLNGYSDLENKVKMNGNERYNIYSCSKVITCTAAHQLSSPAQGLRSMAYRFARAELCNESEFDRIYKDLREIHNYNLTY